LKLHAGLEYLLWKSLEARGGYTLTRLGELNVERYSLGLGFILGNFQVNYAYLPFRDIGDTYRVLVLIPLGVKFGKFRYVEVKRKQYMTSSHQDTNTTPLIQ
jgi:hypothetical protein